MKEYSDVGSLLAVVSIRCSDSSVDVSTEGSHTQHIICLLAGSTVKDNSGVYCRTTANSIDISRRTLSKITPSNTI